MLTLAVVPARGGSKGVERKNLQLVGERSLLERAVRVAIESGVIDRVLVSTDDEEVRIEAVRCGAEVPFLRPGELATDEAPTVDVVVHAVEEYERLLDQRADTVVVLEPTSPFRRPEHVRAAITRYREGSFGSVVSVCPLERKPENIFRKATASGALERYIREPSERFPRRQGMRHLCRLNSAIYVCGWDALVAKRRLDLEPLGYVEMTSLESLNIDEELDLKFANLVARECGL